MKDAAALRLVGTLVGIKLAVMDRMWDGVTPVAHDRLMI